jgi:hypothetical protein
VVIPLMVTKLGSGLSADSVRETTVGAAIAVAIRANTVKTFVSMVKVGLFETDGMNWGRIKGR